MSRIPGEEEKIQNLIKLGISRGIALRALTLNNWDVNRATNAYLDGHVDRIPLPQETRLRRSKFTKTIRKNPGNKYQRYFDFEYDDDVKRIPFGRPVDEEEYSERFIEYEQEKELRKDSFLRRTIEGYEIGRKMHYHAVRLIYFVTEGYDVVKNEVFQDYSTQFHRANLKKVVIIARKAAECAYHLDFFDESARVCHDIIRIVYTHEMSTKMLKLTMGLLGRIAIKQERFRDAHVFIFLGLCQDPGSGINKKAQEQLNKACENVKDLEYSDLEKKLFETGTGTGWNLWKSEENKKLWWDCVFGMCPRTHPDFCQFDMKEEQAKADERYRIDYLMVSDHGFRLEEENMRFFRDLEFKQSGMRLQVMKILF